MPENSSYFDPFYSAPSVNPEQSPRNFKSSLEEFFNRSGGKVGSSISPLDMLSGFVSGRGGLSAGDETGSFQLNPGGSFSLTSPTGFSVSGDPMSKSLGVDLPVSVGKTKGTVGLQGSFNPIDPSIQARFKFGQRSMPVPEEIGSVKAESSVSGAVSPWQAPPEKSSQPTARELADQFINQYRSSGGRDPNSPSSWF
jgi:hypothetical protein